MAKKSILVWLTLLMVLFSSISIYADENVQGDFFVKHVIVNGQEIVNYNLQYPFFIYSSTLYIPLTKEMGQIFGFESTVDWDSHTLKLLKTDSTRKTISSNWMKNDKNPTSCIAVPDMNVIAYDQATSEAGIESILDIQMVSIEQNLLSEGTPVLCANGTVYLPLRFFSESQYFGWDICFDPYYGVCISTDPSVSAASYVDLSESLLNRGYVNYILAANGNMSVGVAQNYVFFFKRAANVYNIDERLLMAIARRESHFNYASGGYSQRRPAGMMQIMPSTGERWGYSLTDLYDPYKNICFGAMYISDRIQAYNGDWVVGLSAYNQGSTKVNRGSYSTTYATKVIETYNEIGTYLMDNGFIYFEPVKASLQIEPIG